MAFGTISGLSGNEWAHSGRCSHYTARYVNSTDLSHSPDLKLLPIYVFIAIISSLSSPQFLPNISEPSLGLDQNLPFNSLQNLSHLHNGVAIVPLRMAKRFAKEQDEVENQKTTAGARAVL